MRRPLPLVALLALSSLLVGCSADAATDAASPVGVSSPSPTVSPTPTDPPAPEPTPSASPSPTPTAPATPTVSYDVAAVQRTLTDLRYYVGPIDGKAGGSVRSAVMAFQKVNGLGADGVVGPATLAALAAPRAPELKATAPANRVEIDLSKQVLYVVKGGAVARILPVSSGNGATYRQKNGGKARALTPVGWYKVERRIVGVRKADLGTLYDPQYFYRGWAIHGSNSVPAGPASHGCVRVTRSDAKWLLSNISVGMSVYLYGGKHVFTAGSSAPGTDNPTGDDGGAAPAPAPPPEPPPSSQPSSPPPPEPTDTGSPTPSDSASPSPSQSGLPTPP